MERARPLSKMIPMASARARLESNKAVAGRHGAARNHDRSGDDSLFVVIPVLCGGDKRSDDALSGIAFRRFLLRLVEYSPVVIDESYS